MDATKTRQIVRQRLVSRLLPKNFDLTSFTVGCPPSNTCCVGCSEKFLSSYIDAVGHRLLGRQYWFHVDCEKLRLEERSLNHFVRPHQGQLRVSPNPT